DIVVRTVAEAQDPATTTLADICSHAVVTVTPTESVEEAVRLMRTHAIRRVPVVDGGQPVGIVSLGDLAVGRDPDSALGEMSSAPRMPKRGAGLHHRHAVRVCGTSRGGVYGGDAGRDPGGRTTNWAGTGAQRGAPGGPRGAATTHSGTAAHLAPRRSAGAPGARMG